jgi:RNA recognition motif-containing protein
MHLQQVRDGGGGHEVVVKDDARVVKMRGLPWEVTPEDIARFFATLDIAPEGVSIALNFDGRPTGDGFVCFASADHATLALQR